MTTCSAPKAHPDAFLFSGLQTEAMRKQEALHARAEWLALGGPPLSEVCAALPGELATEAEAAEGAVSAALAALEVAEAVLLDVDEHPRPNEKPERWDEAHREVVRLRRQLRRTQKHLDDVRASVERLAHKARQP